MTPEEERRVAALERRAHTASEEIVDHAVKKVFAILGVDIDSPQSVTEFQESLRFSKKLSKAADHSFLVFVGAITIAISVALWNSFTGGSVPKDHPHDKPVAPPKELRQ